MNHWLSTAGGIQTVNRKLACALAALDDTFECVAVVMAASDAEAEDASLHSVRLIRGQSDEDWTSVLLLKELREIDPSTVSAVIGHSYFSGPQAIQLRDNFFPAATAVQFVHMSPMHTEPLKEYRRDRYVAERERRIALELALAKKADIVACVGPRLHRYMNQQLVAAQAKPSVVRVNGGFERTEGERSIPGQPTILCLGRSDSVVVKGIDLFAIAAGELTKRWMQHPATDKRPPPEFIIRGAKDEPEALQAQLVKLSIRENGIGARIHVRPYTTRADELTQDLRGASVFVMPSREEGFGLVACEALSLGVPVLVTSESGLAETMREMAIRTGQDVSGSIVWHAGSDETVAIRYAEYMLRVLVDEQTAGQRARQIFERLLLTNSWTEAAKALRDALEVHKPIAAATAMITHPSTPRPVVGSLVTKDASPSPKDVPTGFVGRAAELAELSRSLGSSNSQRIVNVHGLHGIGKTSIAREFARQAMSGGGRCHYVSFQVTASGDGSFVDGFLPREAADKELNERLWSQIPSLSNLSVRDVIVFDEIEALLYHMDKEGVISILRRILQLGNRYSYRARPEGEDMPAVIVISRRNWAQLEWQVVLDSPMLSQMPRMMLPPLNEADCDALFKFRSGEQATQHESFSRHDLVALSGGIPLLVQEWLTEPTNSPGVRQGSLHATYSNWVHRVDWYFRATWQALSGIEQRSVVSAMLCRLGQRPVLPEEHQPSVHSERLGATSAAFCWWLVCNDVEFSAEENSDRRAINRRANMPSDLYLLRGLKRLRSFKTIPSLIEAWTLQSNGKQ